MISCARHGYDDKRLNENANGESVHGEAGCIDLRSEDWKYTLWCISGIAGGEAGIVWRRMRLEASFARNGAISREIASFSGELFKRYGNKRACLHS
jgi:hypothetical protein